MIPPMCGICGILAPEVDPALRRRRVERMTRAMVHRGPDDQGFYHDAEMSLGFRRLAVIDLETGQQPIRLEADRAAIVLNGEIYNYRELRRDLEPRHRFTSKGDVEAVLRLYAERGIAALRSVRGMFALALWDRSRRTLYLARDRFGIKPLFVCRQGATLAFASEIGSLLAGGFPERRTIHRLELRHYLGQKYLSPGGSILEGVRSLRPAHVLEVGPGAEREYPYWEPPQETDRRIASAEAEDGLATRLRDAVRRQLVADVPVGVFLSGGLDSSTLTALVRDAEAGPVRTFSVGFEGPGAVNELPAARGIAAALRTEHHEIVMKPEEVAADLPAILGGLDGPLGDATAIPTWYMSRLARQAATVALSGEGADEVFGGYPRQRYDVRIDRLGPPGRVALRAALRLSGRKASPRLVRRLKMKSGLARHLDWSRIFTADAIDTLTLDPLPSEDEVSGLHAALATRWERRSRLDPVNARLEADRELFLPGDLLVKVDRMSMAHSLEVRVPYLDEEVFEFVAALPGKLKVRGCRGKVLLRSAAASIVPAGAASRRKQGFDVPIAAWLRGPLRDALAGYLSEDSVRRRGLFRPQAVASLVREHLERRVDHGERLWLLLVLEGWLQQVLDRAGGTDS